MIIGKKVYVILVVIFGVCFFWVGDVWVCINGINMVIFGGFFYVRGFFIVKFF